MSEREITRAQLEAIRTCSSLNKSPPPHSTQVQPPNHSAVQLLEALEVLHSRAGRATPPGIYQEINNRWCLIEHGEAELLESLGKAAVDLLTELVTLRSRGLLQKSRLGRRAHRLEQALRRVPSFDRDKLLPGVTQPYPWNPPTLDSVLNDVCPRRNI
jgi:hypothetical protein